MYCNHVCPYLFVHFVYHWLPYKCTCFRFQWKKIIIFLLVCFFLWIQDIHVDFDNTHTVYNSFGRSPQNYICPFPPWKLSMTINDCNIYTNNIKFYTAIILHVAQIATIHSRSLSRSWSGDSNAIFIFIKLDSLCSLMHILSWSLILFIMR